MKDEKQKAQYLQLLESSLSVMPSTQRNLIVALQSFIEDTDTVLDIGCGMKIVTRHLACTLTGIDICPDYLVGGDICGDVRNLPEFLGERRFDVVVGIDIIEHLTKQEGIKLLADIQRVADKKVFLSTPTKWTDNVAGVSNPASSGYGNVWNYHRSAWDADDFYNMGYMVIPGDFSNEFILVMKEIQAGDNSANPIDTN